MIRRHTKVISAQWIIRTPLNVNVFSDQITVTSLSGRKPRRYSLSLDILWRSYVHCTSQFCALQEYVWFWVNGAAQCKKFLLIFNQSFVNSSEVEVKIPAVFL